jgi:UDP-N-acetylmuramoyl-tripeptide--D-alanyl-D-alanine ligase
MMMSQVAQALDATLYGDDVMLYGVSKDTRDIHEGDLYVALKGERFDGHQFVVDATAAGAVAALVSERLENESSELPQVQVADTQLALGQLAAYWRQNWGQQNTNRMVGITGSNGKTSVKEMCSKILCDYAGAELVLATQGNLNNEIGLPMTLLELREQHQFAVIEMGANHVGEIDYLSNIAKPDVALVNNVGPAHLEGFGSLQNIAKAKAEIYNGLSEDGVAIINFDDEFSAYWQDCCSAISTIGKVITFSMKDASADVYAKQLDDNCYQLILQGCCVEEHAEQCAELRLQVPGKHNVMNALAATAATYSLGIPLSSIAASLSAFENIKGRLTAITAVQGYQVIDDTYNANPLSVSAAIDVLADMPAEQTVLVLGDMAELGEDAERLHSLMGEKAKDAGIQRLYATGKFSVNTVRAFGENGFYFEDKEQLISDLQKTLTGSEVVLIKGSRSAAMEEVVERILTQNNNHKRVN